MADEDEFWAGALTLRKNNWCLVSGRGGLSAHLQQGSHLQLLHGNRLGTGSQLFVHYGFRDGKGLHLATGFSFSKQMCQFHQDVGM
jgi:hypothetical protein